MIQQGVGVGWLVSCGMLTDDSAGSWGWMVGECCMLTDDSAGSWGCMVGECCMLTDDSAGGVGVG